MPVNRRCRLRASPGSKLPSRSRGNSIVAIDEFQRYSEHPDHGKVIVALLTELAKVDPDQAP